MNAISREMTSLSEARCWELLASQEVGRLAVGGERPDIFPVNYRVADHRVVIQTAEGQKLVAAADHHVAFEADALDQQSRTGWSVVVRGLATEPKLVEQYLQALDLKVEPWAIGEKSRFLIIEPGQISGREFPKPGR